MPHAVSTPNERLIRLNGIIGPSGLVPVSRTTWYGGIKSGRFPKPVKLGARISAWRLSDIRKIIEGGDKRDSK